MAIAVSVLVRTSRCLLAMQAGMGLLALVTPAALWPADAPLRWLAVLAGLLVMGHPLRAYRNRKGYRIDISDHGQFRLAVYQSVSPQAAPAATTALLSAALSPAALLPGAVLWPWLLMLPLRLADGRTVRVLVLRDSVAPGVFHPLAVACRACAARGR